MEHFPLIVIGIGFVISVISIPFPKYRELALIGYGTLPCALYMIVPAYWQFYLLILIAGYLSEIWRRRSRS